jgi:ArsR family transcriptional regulator
MIEAMDEITLLQAEVLRTMAHPRRIQILHELADGPIEVRRLASRVGATQPNVSQHLAAMRSVGLVDFERDGREVRYRLTDRRSVEACELMRTVIADRLRRLAEMTRDDGPRVAAAADSSAAIGSASR